MGSYRGSKRNRKTLTPETALQKFKDLGGDPMFLEWIKREIKPLRNAAVPRYYENPACDTIVTEIENLGKSSRELIEAFLKIGITEREELIKSLKNLSLVSAEFDKPLPKDDPFIRGLANARSLFKDADPGNVLFPFGPEGKAIPVELYHWDKRREFKMFRKKKRGGGSPSRTFEVYCLVPGLVAYLRSLGLKTPPWSLIDCLIHAEFGIKRRDVRAWWKKCIKSIKEPDPRLDYYAGPLTQHNWLKKGSQEPPPFDEIGSWAVLDSGRRRAIKFSAFSFLHWRGGTQPHMPLKGPYTIFPRSRYRTLARKPLDNDEKRYLKILSKEMPFLRREIKFWTSPLLEVETYKGKKTSSKVILYSPY